MLVQDLSNGDVYAFNALYNEYSGRLYHFANGYLKSEAESEELVQEVFTIIWEKRANLKEELSFKSYLFTIAFNIIKKHFRTRTYLSAYYKYYANEYDFRTIQTITHDSLSNYISELVNQLPARRREIFIKSRFEGFNIKEIALQLNIKTKTVENQLTSALKFLRMSLNREEVYIDF
jgi:RNA polymerase sigma-70 factor (family 1)